MAIKKKNEDANLVKVEKLAKYKVNIGAVNFRTEPSTDADIIKVLYFGTVVDVKENKGEWTSCVYDGISGYVMSKYLVAAEG